MEPKKPLSTADFANVDEVRGQKHEEAIGRTAVAETPVSERRPDAVRETMEPVRSGPMVKPGSTSPAEGHAPLFPAGEIDGLRRRWTDVQAAFVDEPRRAVEQADALVAEVMKHLAEVFANERATLEHQWDRGDNVTTEDLRVALQKYRSFFDRLLSF